MRQDHGSTAFVVVSLPNLQRVQSYFLSRLLLVCAVIWEVFRPVVSMSVGNQVCGSVCTGGFLRACSVAGSGGSF